MLTETLHHILCDELEGTDTAGDVVLPIGTRLTLLLRADRGPMLPVQKVTGVRFAGGYLVLTSDDGRVFIDPSDVMAVRADTEHGAGRDSRLGFS